MIPSDIAIALRAKTGVEEGAHVWSRRDAGTFELRVGETLRYVLRRFDAIRGPSSGGDIPEPYDYRLDVFDRDELLVVGSDDSGICKHVLRWLWGACARQNAIVSQKGCALALGAAGTGRDPRERPFWRVEILLAGNGKLYVNGGTKAQPTWKLVTSAA